jgi:predicted HTH domain antitoxin
MQQFRTEIMSNVTINLPEEVFSARRLSPEEFVRDMRLAAAIYWYQKQEISMEKAANVAGLNRRDFLAVLAREQVDVFAVDFDDLQSELNRG